jgi:hypothetical protein
MSSEKIMVVLRRIKNIGPFIAEEGFLGPSLNSPGWQAIDPLLEMIRVGSVGLRRLEFARRPDEVLPRGVYTGGKHHRRLCATAAQWLEANGLGSSGKQTYGHSGIADVRSRKGSIAVECGTGIHHKILRDVSKGGTMLALPYPDWSPVEGHQRLVGLLFTPRKKPVRSARVVACPACLRGVPGTRTPIDSVDTFGRTGRAGFTRRWLLDEHHAPCGNRCISAMITWEGIKPVRGWHHPLWCERCPVDTSDLTEGLPGHLIIGSLPYNVFRPFEGVDSIEPLHRMEDAP